MGRIPQQQVPQPQKPIGQHFMNTSEAQFARQLQQQQLSQMSLQQQHMAFSPPPSSDVSDGGRFAPDNLVPGLRPQRSRDQSAGGMYPDERALMEERELNRQMQQQQNLFSTGPGGPTQQQLFEYRQQDLLRQQQQQLIAQGMQKQQQQQFANQNIGNRGGSNLMGFRNGPSPIGGQNPMIGPQTHQRGMSGAMGGPLSRTPTQDLGAIGIGMGGGMGGMRSAQDMGVNQMRVAQDMALAGLHRGGADIGGPFTGQQGFPPSFGLGSTGQNPMQAPLQRAMPPNHHLQQQQLAGGMMVPPNVGPRGSADFDQHERDLQAARLRHQAQIQQQLGLGGSLPQQSMGPQGQSQQQLRLQQLQLQQQQSGLGGLPPHLLQQNAMAAMAGGQLPRQQQQNRNILGDFGAVGMNGSGPLGHGFSGPGLSAGGMGAAGQQSASQSEQILQFLRGGNPGPLGV